MEDALWRWNGHDWHEYVWVSHYYSRLSFSYIILSDYMYSGHTSIITSSALFILEYSPRRWWVYHYIVQIAAIIGVFCILVAHEVPSLIPFSFLLFTNSALHDRHNHCLLHRVQPFLDVSHDGRYS